MRKTFVTAASCLLALASSSSVLANDTNANVINTDTWGTSVGLSAGTTGTNLTIGKSLNNHVGVRADIYMSGSVSETDTIDGNNFNLKFSPKTNGLVFDLMPFSGAFHVSAGFYQQDINMTLTGNTTGSLEIGSTTYGANQLDSFTGKLGFSKTTAPYLGFGWSNRYNQKSGLGYSFEVGLIDIGTPKATLTGTCATGASACTQSTLDTNLKSEESNINSEMDAKGMWPIITFGLNYRF